MCWLCFIILIIYECFIFYCFGYVFLCWLCLIIFLFNYVLLFWVCFIVMIMFYCSDYVLLFWLSFIVLIMFYCFDYVLLFDSVSLRWMCFVCTHWKQKEISPANYTLCIVRLMILLKWFCVYHIASSYSQCHIFGRTFWLTQNSF